MKRITSSHSIPHDRLFVAFVFFLFLTNAFAQEVPVFEWAKAMGGTNFGESRSIAIDASGNVLTTGYFEGTVDFDPGAGAFNLTSGSGDIFISKLDASGNFVWAKQLGGTGFDVSYSIATDASGNVLTTGYFEGTGDFDPGAGTFNLNSAGFVDIFISKLDASGNFVWAKQLGGGTGNDISYSIATDASGNVLTTGYFTGTGDFDPGAGTFNLTSPGNRDIFISKLDASGNFVWAKRLGGTGNDDGYSIAIDASGNVLTTGEFFGTSDFDPGTGTFNLTSAGSWDIFISKLDASGNFVWAKKLGGTSTDFGNSIAIDASGNVFTTGNFQVSGDFDPGAGTFNLTSAGSYDIFISKLDASGNFGWAKQLGGTSTDFGNSIAIDASGNVFTTGDFIGTGDFDPGPATFSLTSAGDADGFISKLDASGNFVWAIQSGGTGTDRGYSIAIDALGNVLTTGYFEETVDFDPGACSYNLVSAGSNDSFIQKLSIGTAIPSPTFTSFSPALGPIGTTVTITGTNFSTTPANNIVQFFNNQTATVTASTATSITTTVPAGATTGKISVTLNCNLSESTNDFIIGETGNELIIYNAVSPGNDSKNDFFRLENIEVYTTNTVTIFNRWGDAVWEGSNYDNSTVVFNGISTNGKDLPTGTYFYKIQLSSGLEPKTGFLSLKR
jgi:gliding motility-associated-like protein